MRLTSAQEGVYLCFDGYCNQTQCIQGNKDYFGVWRYEGVNIGGMPSIGFLIWLLSFIFVFFSSGIVIIAVILTILSLISKPFSKGK
jgi:hypothetical protein